MAGSDGFEVEKARRLMDRFSQDASAEGELAREKRAHNVSASLRDTLQKRQTGRLSLDIVDLEARLELRQRDSLSSMFAGKAAGETSQSGVPAAIIASTSAASSSSRPQAAAPPPLTHGPPVALRPNSTEAPAHTASTASTSPAPASPVATTAPTGRQRVKNAYEALKETLDEISVKSVLDFRSAGSGVLAAETVATAAVCAIANIDDTVQVSIHSLDPEAPWAEALQVLSKPGHFINSLRRFPEATAAGRVPDDNIIAARHYLEMASTLPSTGSSSFHPAVRHLSRWVGSAIRYWEERTAAAEEDCTSSHSPGSTGSPLRMSYGGASGSRAPKSVLTSGSPPPTSGGYPARLGASQTTQRSTVPARVTQPVAAPKQAPVPKARPSGSPRPQPGTAPGMRPAMSPQPRQGSSSGLIRSGALASPGVRSTMSSTLNNSTSSSILVTHGHTSPNKGRPNGSPRPTASPMRSSLMSTSTADSMRPMRGTVSSATGPVRPAASPVPARVSPKRSLRTSPMPSRPASGPHLSVSNLSKSMSSLNTRQPLTAMVATRNGPAIPTVNGRQPESLQEWRKMLEDTKREVREIKAIESNLKWNIAREEKKERLHEAKSIVSDERDFRWKQEDEMKAFRAAKGQEARKTDLKDSKAFQEFKREVKAKTCEEEKRQIREDYLRDTENAKGRAELANVLHEREKDLVNMRFDNLLENREITNLQKQHEKMEADENRVLEQTLEMQAMAMELAREKEELLRNIEHGRTAERAAPRSYGSPASLLGQLS